MQFKLRVIKLKKQNDYLIILLIMRGIYLL